ncbi:hypothetical protein JOB18_035672 [Solea senegalensis]|uniref:C-type lectin domain-containing protein n=1 Tax=Solea senegalensis TaxID=28829 RepID=A0AAV6QVG2_SOLSE|nr:CD209 antigen-like protein C [Solea senegalensis]KAG7497324.1 hypothetical protein JOB18_035672 [Solea senegalensis]
MDPSERLAGVDEDRETPAGAGSCQICRRRARVAVAMVMVISSLLLALVLFAMWTAAQGHCQTSCTSDTKVMECLQQCQKERRDLELMLHTVTQDSRCSLCPGGWLWWRGHCYFFSVGLQENREWNKSAEFCRDHNSSLAVIKDSAEMDFIQGVMKTFQHLPYLWVGLTDSRREGQWLWWDGTHIQHYMPVTVEWDSDQRDCADLRGGGSLFAVDCESFGPWVCKRGF